MQKYWDSDDINALKNVKNQYFTWKMQSLLIFVLELMRGMKAAVLGLGIT